MFQLAGGRGIGAGQCEMLAIITLTQQVSMPHSNRQAGARITRVKIDDALDEAASWLSLDLEVAVGGESFLEALDLFFQALGEDSALSALAELRATLPQRRETKAIREHARKKPLAPEEGKDRPA